MPILRKCILNGMTIGLVLGTAVVAPNVVSVKAQTTSERQAEADRLLCEMGTQQYYDGQHESAAKIWQESLLIYQSVRSQNGEAWALNFLGLVYFSLGKYDESIATYNQALPIFRSLQQAIIHPASNQTAEILDFSFKGSRECDRLKLQPLNGEAQTLRGLAQAYNAKAEYARALELYEQALPLFRAVPDHNQEALTLLDLGVVYRSLGQYDQAISLYQQALPIFRSLKNSWGEAYTLKNWGFVYFSQSKYKEAIGLYQQALPIFQMTKDLNAEAYTLVDMGLAYAALSCCDKAIDLYQRSLPIFMQISERKGEAYALMNLGNVYRLQSDYDQAISFYQKALPIFHEVEDHEGQALILRNIGQIFSEQSQPELSIIFLKQSVNVYESIRGDNRALSQELQQSYINTIADTYRSLSSTLLAQGRILEAQQVLELLKLQELREFTGVRAKVTPNGIALTPVEQEIATQHDGLIAFGQQVNQCQKTQCSQLTALLDQRDQLTHQFNETLRTFDAEMRARLAQDLGALKTQNFSRSAREIVEAQPGTVMIYAVVLDNKLWLLWASTGGVVNSIEVPVTREKLGETVLQFRQLLSTQNSDISQVQATAKQLYDWLIAPIAPELQKNHIQHLVFSLDRVTRYIPMAALFDGQHYLLENYTVSTVLSADLTRVGDRLPPGTDQTSVLALGLSNPVPPEFPGGLPDVPAELDAIVRSANDPQGIYPGLKFLNQQFDDHTLRDNVLGHQIVHIATHGVFVPGRQDQSYLVLGNGHHMSISSIQELQDLGGVRLVVLSACQTALGGPDQDGIEIAGIAYYFLNGGVNTVMASLWSVNDASTQQLMQHFYHNLAQSTAQAPITRAEALRQAQLSLLHGETNGVGNAGRSIVRVTPRPGTSPATPASPGLSHPYYWAPFILIGNGL